MTNKTNDEIAYPTGCHPNNWEPYPIGNTHVFLSKSSHVVKYIDETGVVRSFEDDAGKGLRQMLETAKVGSAPERTRVRTDVGGSPTVETTRMHAGIWEGREKERQEAIAQTRHFNEVNGVANYVPSARSVPYEPNEE